MSELSPDTESTELHSSITPTLSASDETDSKNDSDIESWADKENVKSHQVRKIEYLFTKTLSE